MTSRWCCFHIKLCHKRGALISYHVQVLIMSLLAAYLLKCSFISGVILGFNVSSSKYCSLFTFVNKVFGIKWTRSFFHLHNHLHCFPDRHLLVVFGEQWTRRRTPTTRTRQRWWTGWTVWRGSCSRWARGA